MSQSTSLQHSLFTLCIILCLHVLKANCAAGVVSVVSAVHLQFLECLLDGGAEEVDKCILFSNDSIFLRHLMVFLDNSQLCLQPKDVC